MFQIKVEASFKADYKRVAQSHPEIRRELARAVELLRSDGALPEGYSPHELASPGGNYNGHMEFHLAEGRFDVLVIYMPHKTSLSIRLVRMGSHEELFQGGPR